MSRVPCTLAGVIFTEDLSKGVTMGKGASAEGFGSVIASFKILLRTRKNHKRTVLILLQIVIATFRCIVVGEARLRSGAGKTYIG